ncbi:ParH-like protein [Kitasatospora sp. LaBMicrA B282]|uniref:ParH-like protein n=1 Tax=Kitasatospora sp. LaBMicrA B282 TaxID=3420949 RepID=UPI003D0A92C2
MGHPDDVAERGLWRRCRRIAESLPLPEPFDIPTLTESLAGLRGKPIELVPLSGPEHSPCGILIGTDRADYIGYPVNTTALHQQHIVLHEIGHLLCGHAGISPLGATAVRTLTPRLSDELVRRVLGRSAYSESQEQEAELIASLALQRVLRRPGPPAGAVGELADQVERLSLLFGRPNRPGRTRRG